MAWRDGDSSELNMIRPSLSGTGCSAAPRFKWPIISTFLPSSSMMKSCAAGCVSSRTPRMPLRSLTNASLPPGTGHGPRL
ncbi:hypothetical protein D3C83_164030 [compost metagenome]